MCYTLRRAAAMLCRDGAAANHTEREGASAQRAPATTVMTKVFFDVMMALDGFMAPDGMDMAHAHDPEYKQWAKKWGELTQWVLRQKFFRENLRLGEGGETGRDNALMEETFQRTGASIMGRKMFDAGERFWPEEAPFHTAVYVLTHRAREPWERPGGTTFYFVPDGIESALRRAREAAGGKDIRVAGGAKAVQQYLNAGVVDEFTVHYAPVFFGEGVRLFENIDPNIRVKVKEIIPSSDVTHVVYAIER